MFTPRSESLVIEEPNNLVELLRRRARAQADRTAYVFLADGLREEASLSYGELDGRARAIAAALQTRVGAGERVLLLLPPGLDYVAAFFGCLYAGAVAVPAYPPRSNRNLHRAESIVADAEASLALTADAVLSRIRPLLAESQSLRALGWLAVEEASRADEGAWREPAVGGDSLAFLQYTSGSTSTPRGVMVSHRNLLHNEEFIRRAFAQSERSVIVGWLPLYHDMGLIGNVLQPLYLGAPCVLMSPMSFLRRPAQWLEAITRYGATTSGGPNFAYELCARKVSAEERESLDLSSWGVAFNGAEPIRQETLEKFAQTFAPCGFRREAFRPCYGLAEATLLVTVGEYARGGAPAVRTVRLKELGRHRAVEAADEGVRAVVGCGAAGDGQKVCIVDPETRVECAAGAVGEIWVSGPSVAAGYWNRPEENARTFGARLAANGEGPFLRTGDLGFVQDGELFVAGRLKELIIIRGLNHYPQDIEQTVEGCHAALRPGGGAAFSVEVAGEERLVVVHEFERRQPLDLEGAAGKIRQAVMERHELHVYGVVLIKAGTLPKTSSGKVQRHVCRESFLAGGLQEVWRDVLEEAGVAWAETSLTRETLLAAAGEERQRLLREYLLAQAARAVGADVSRLDARKNLASLGLDSLMAIELKGRLEGDLGVRVPVTDFLEDESVARVAERVLERLEAEGEAHGRAPRAAAEHQPAEMPLSHLQRSLWFIHQLAPQSPAYNIAFALRILPAADAEALRRALLTLVERHASLRTTFETRGGEPVQRVTEGAHFEVKDASGLGVEGCASALQAEASRPFDLERGPVFRAILFKGSAEGDVLLMVVHHIVFDGWSLWVLLDELAALYAAESKGAPASLPAVGAGYADFVRWQSGLLEGEEGERLWDYWRRELGDELPALDLPTFKPRPAFQTFSGRAHAFDVDERLAGRLRALARAEGTTLYTVLLAAFQALLYRYTGQDDFAVGSPTSSRGPGDFERVVGCFFNAVVLRARPDGGLTFREYLRRTRRTVLGALAHQDYPSHLLAERLGGARDASRPPLFQVTFILQQPHRLHDSVRLPATSAERAAGDDGFVMQLLPLERDYARTDLELEMLEAGGAISAALRYNTDLFDAAFVERMSEHFRNLLSGAAARPDQRLDELTLLTASEVETLLARPSTSQGSHAFESPIHDLFSARAAAAPLQVAAFHQGASLTYGQLEEQSDKLANLIRGLTR